MSKKKKTYFICLYVTIQISTFNNGIKYNFFIYSIVFLCIKICTNICIVPQAGKFYVIKIENN